MGRGGKCEKRKRRIVVSGKEESEFGEEDKRRRRLRVGKKMVSLEEDDKWGRG